MRPTTVIQRFVLLLVALCVVVYLGDFLWFQYQKHFSSSSVFGAVRMERMYAIPQKNGRVEFQFDAQAPEENVRCVHSLFPHTGLDPCWYLRRNAQKVIPMSIFGGRPHATGLWPLP